VLQVANGGIALVALRHTSRPLWQSILLYCWIIMTACWPFSIKHDTWKGFWKKTVQEPKFYRYDFDDPNCFDDIYAAITA
jgi:hypothetical protein